MTYLDWYMYLTLLFLCIQGLLHCWTKLALDAGTVLSVSRARRYERYALAVVAFAWLALHAAIVVFVGRFVELRTRRTFDVRAYLEDRDARHRASDEDRGVSSGFDAPAARGAWWYRHLPSLASPPGSRRPLAHKKSQQNYGLNEIFATDEDTDDDNPASPSPPRSKARFGGLFSSS